MTLISNLNETEDPDYPHPIFHAIIVQADKLITTATEAFAACLTYEIESTAEKAETKAKLNRSYKPDTKIVVVESRCR